MTKRIGSIEVDLPDLSPGTRDDFSARVIEVFEFRDVDLSDVEAANARLLECAILDCRLDDAGLRGARIADCVIERSSATALDTANSTWRTVVATDCRFGALTAYGSSIEQVRFTGTKIDYFNLRDAALVDVEFDGCRIGELDLGGARLNRVGFKSCLIERLELGRAELRDVDFSRAELQAIEGIAELAGATISEAQLHDLAHSFAEHLGVRVVAAPSDAAT